MFYFLKIIIIKYIKIITYYYDIYLKYLKGPKGLINYVIERLKKRRTCVIVVAEGAGESMRDTKLPSLGKDASGNTKMTDIGIFLRDILNLECKKKDIDLTLKYIDPTYMIRSVPANAHDTKLCS